MGGPGESRRRIDVFSICELSQGQLELSITNLHHLSVRTPELVCWAKTISNGLNTVADSRVKNSWPLPRGHQLLGDGQSSDVCPLWPQGLPPFSDLMIYLRAIPLTK